MQTYEEASPKTFIAKGLVVEKTLALFEEMDRDTTNSSKSSKMMYDVLITYKDKRTVALHTTLKKLNFLWLLKLISFI